MGLTPIALQACCQNHTHQLQSHCKFCVVLQIPFSGYYRDIIGARLGQWKRQWKLLYINRPEGNLNSVYPCKSKHRNPPLLMTG